LRRTLGSKQIQRWIVIAAIALLVLAIILLGYALLPGGETVRVQSTLNPTMVVAP